MKEEVFQINDRFLIDKSKNEVLDRVKYQRSRLEPRLMKLLCLLVGNHGKALTREFIIKEIWDDYPGANEGLNQAISFLRKLLGDEQKEIIKTLPKTGYSFHGTLSPAPEKTPSEKKKLNWINLITIGILSLILLFVILFYFNTKHSYRQSEEQVRKAVEISRLDSIHQAEKLKQSEEK